MSEEAAEEYEGGEHYGFENDDDEALPLEDDEGGGGRSFDLVDAPAKVNKVEISYAKVAKQVDIKGLKSHVWQELCGGSEQMGEGVSFQHVVSRVGERVSACEPSEGCTRLVAVGDGLHGSLVCRSCRKVNVGTSPSHTVSYACFTWPTRKGWR